MAQFGSVEAVVQVLEAGRAAVFPTDTVYGIGVAIARTSSAAEVFAAKRRDADKAVPWLVGDFDALSVYGTQVPSYARNLAKLWPGPITLVVAASDAVPSAFASSARTVALRMPDDSVALNLIARVGCPLATSSANFQGCAPPQTYADVAPDFLDQVMASCGDDAPRSGRSSTIVDCTGPTPRILRIGDVSPHEVARLSGV